MSEKKTQEKTTESENQERSNDDSQILRFRKIWMDAMEDFEMQIPEVPDVAGTDPDTADRRLREYISQLQALIAVNEKSQRANLFERCLGLQRWHLGKALLLLKPLGKGERGLIKHGEWQTFLESVWLDDLLAWRCRAIADFFPRREDAAALNWQWTVMVESLPSRKKESADGAASDEGAETSGISTDAEPDKDNDDHKDYVVPIGNHLKRLREKATDCRDAIARAIKIYEEGTASGVTLSSAQEAATFKSYVAELETVGGIIHESAINLFKLAEFSSSSELSDIREGLADFIQRHEAWRGTVKEDAR